MALCALPSKPIHSDLQSSYLILDHTNESAESFFNAFQDIRKARGAKGTATDHEQDLLRAALIFSAAGLDSMVKQLIRDTLKLVIQKKPDARRQFSQHVKSRLERREPVDLQYLAAAISASNSTDFLQDEFIRELTGSSLQSKDQLLSVASYFAIRWEEITKAPNELESVFRVRNQIAHEMDIMLGQPNRGRRQRKVETMKKHTTTILATAKAFYLAVESRLS